MKMWLVYGYGAETGGSADEGLYSLNQAETAEEAVEIAADVMSKEDRSRKEALRRVLKAKPIAVSAAGVMRWKPPSIR